MAMLPTIKSNIPFVMDTLGRSDLAKKDILNKYLQLEGFTHESEFGGDIDKHGRSPFGMTFATCLSRLKKTGAISSPKRGVYSLEDESLILGSFIKLSSTSTPTPTPKPTPKPTPTYKPTPKPTVEETTPTVEETTPKIEVSVSNPAVIEAHIDTDTQELVENVGGSRDYRQPLDKVEDGYITSTVPSSVQVSTTTLETVVEDDVDQPVEVEVASVEVVEPTLVEETLLEDEPLEIVLVEDQEEDVQPRYDLQKLRKNASFDPCSIHLKNGAKGDYDVFRDMEARNIVLTQKGRDDYEIIPVDVDLERIKNIPEHGGKFARLAEMTRQSFDTAKNHKEGCDFVVKALISCCKLCNHTDDFGGFVEPCMSSDRTCILRSIWTERAIYVNPKDS